MRTLALIAAAGVATLTAGRVDAENWPNWRGPNYNGSADATGLPVKFSKTKYVVWKVDLPGRSAATPIIQGDKIFLSSTEATAGKNMGNLVALCLDRRTGKPVWRKTVGGKRKLVQNRSRSTYASPSPVTDGKRVFFFYGTGDLVAFDMDGNKLWAKNIRPEHGFSFMWTFSCSPALVGDKLYMQVLQNKDNNYGSGKGKRGGDESYILALDPATGNLLWKHMRQSTANRESSEAFSTPIPHKVNGHTELLVVGGDCLTGHDLDSGKELWRWGTWNPKRIGHWRLVPSPVAGGGVVLACAPKSDPIYAVKVGLQGTYLQGTYAVKVGLQGTKEMKDGLAWSSGEPGNRGRNLSSDVPTPLFYKGKFFVLNDNRKMLSRVDPATGTVEWTKRMPHGAKWRASPTGADGKVWCINHEGVVAVFDADSGKVLHTTVMAEQGDVNYVRASIAVAHNQLFIRTMDKLYCIGN